jgi:hypothetical protein
MRALGASEVLTNDHHFSQEGFTLLFPGSYPSAAAMPGRCGCCWASLRVNQRRIIIVDALGKRAFESIDNQVVSRIKPTALFVR